VDLVDEAQRAVGAAADLVLGVDQDEPALGAFFWPKANSLAHISAAASKSAADSAPMARICSRDTDSSWPPFSAFVDGRQERLLQALVLAHAVRQRVPAEDPGPLLVVRPDRGAGDAR
jgi:hypothetical protein